MMRLVPAHLFFMATCPGGARRTRTWLPELLVTSQSYLRDVFLYLTQLILPGLMVPSGWARPCTGRRQRSGENITRRCMWVDSELEEDRTLNGGVEMPSVPIRRRKKKSGRPTGHQAVSSLCTLEVCLPECCNC